MNTEELIAFLQKHPGKQVVIETERLITSIKNVETDCFTEGRPWVVVITPDLDEDEDWES